MADVLVVIGDAPTAGDQAIINRLENVLGHNVDTRIDDDPADGTSAYDLVIFAESCSSGQVNKYSGITVPAMVCEGGSWAAFGFSTSFHTASNVTQWNLQSQSVIQHGQGTGNKTVFASNASQHYARISDEVCSGATVVATVAGQSDYAAVFVVDEGGDLTNRTAPARWAAYGLHNGAAPNANSTHWAVFDAVVAWLVGGSTEVKRLYLSSLPATYRRNASAWVTDATGTENTRRLTEQPWGPSVEYSRPETAPNNAPWVLLGMWVSEPLAEPAIVYPQATLCAGMWESSGSANMYPFAVVSVTQGDSTGDLRGTTLSHYNSGRELPTTEQAYRFDLLVVDDGAIQAQAGDRIVIQVGYKPENTSSTPYTGTIAFGGTGSPDLDDGDTDLTRPAWIDITFSEGVRFEEPEVDTRRFYLTSVDTPVEVTSTAGVWDDWTDDIYALGDQPEGDSVPVTITETSPDSGWLGLVSTWVSPPAAADGEILEAPWVSTIAGFESHADANMSHVLAAWIMRPDGSRRVTFVGGLFGGELPVGEANNRGLRLILDPVEVPGAMLLPQQIFEGERIVVEYGVMAQNSSSTPYSATFYAGGTGPDLQANDTGSNARRPAWIDIPVSSGLNFIEVPGGPGGGLQPASIRDTSSGIYTSNQTNHVIDLPEDTQPGDGILVFFASDEINGENLASAPSPWELLDTREQGTSTNVRLSVFWLPQATGFDSLTITTVAAAESAYICYAIQSPGEPAVLMDDGGTASAVPGGMDCEVAPHTQLPEDDYLSIIGLAIDQNPPLPQTVTPPDGWGNLIDVQPETTSGSLVALFGMDRELQGVTDIQPGDIQVRNDSSLADQWVSAHVIFPPGEVYVPPEGDPPVADAGSNATLVSGQQFQRTGTYDDNDASTVITQWEIVDGPSGKGRTFSGDTITYTPRVLGEYTLRFSIVTEFGADSDDVTLTVTDNGTAPGQVFDLKSWHLTTPELDEDEGNAQEIYQPELDSYKSEYLFLDVNNHMLCVAPTNGATTSGASGKTRTEFRERTPWPDYKQASWSMFDRNARSLTVSGYFDPTDITGGSNPRKEMIIGQIHGPTDHPPIYLAAEYHQSPTRIRLFVYNGNGGSSAYPFGNPTNLVPGITPDTLVSYRIEYAPGENPAAGTGRLNIYVAEGDAEQLDLENPDFSLTPEDFFDQTDGWYLKFGAYNKTNIGDAEYGQGIARISFAELLVDDVPIFTTRFFLAG